MDFVLAIFWFNITFQIFLDITLRWYLKAYHRSGAFARISRYEVYRFSNEIGKGGSQLVRPNAPILVLTNMW